MALDPLVRPILDTQSDMRVSVVLPMRGLTEDFPKQFERLALTLTGQDEVLVCDNSNDPENRVFAALQRLVLEHKPSCYFRYVCHFENANAQRNAIAGLKAARGRYVTWIGDDDYWSDNYFDRLADFLDENSDYAGVSGSVRGFTSKVEAQTGPSSVINGATVRDRMLKLLSIQRVKEPEQRGRLIPVQFILLARRVAVTPFLEFAEAFQGRLDLYQCFTAPSLLLFGNFATIEDAIFFNDVENWFGAEKVYTTWVRHFRHFGEPRRCMPHLYIMGCAQLFLFGRYLQRRFPHAVPLSLEFDQIMYGLELYKAEKFYVNFNARDDLVEEERALMKRYPLDLFREDDPKRSTSRVLDVLHDCGAKVAPVMTSLFKELANDA